jgi:hypothetical protein
MLNGSPSSNRNAGSPGWIAKSCARALGTDGLSAAVAISGIDICMAIPLQIYLKFRST